VRSPILYQGKIRLFPGTCPRWQVVPPWISLILKCLHFLLVILPRNKLLCHSHPKWDPRPMWSTGSYLNLGFLVKKRQTCWTGVETILHLKSWALTAPTRPRGQKPAHWHTEMSSPWFEEGDFCFVERVCVWRSLCRGFRRWNHLCVLGLVKVPASELCPPWYNPR
jgi:hypothetical protein